MSGLTLKEIMAVKSRSLLTHEETVDLSLAKDLIEALGFSEDYIVSGEVRYAGREVIRTKIFGNTEEDRKTFSFVCLQIYSLTAHIAGSLSVRRVFGRWPRTRSAGDSGYRRHMYVRRLSSVTALLEVRVS